MTGGIVKQSEGKYAYGNKVGPGEREAHRKLLTMISSG